MAMVAHDKKASKRLGIPQSVGKEYMKADKGKAYAKGGKASLGKLFKGKDTYGEELKEAKAIKSGKISPQQYAKGEKMEDAKKSGKTKKMADGGLSKNDLRFNLASRQDRARAAAWAAMTPGQRAKLDARRQAAENADKAAKANAVLNTPVAERVASFRPQVTGPDAGQAVAAARAANMANRGANVLQQVQAQRPVGQAAPALPPRAPTAPVAAPAMKKGGKTCAKYARGGGVESRGRTKGRFV
jgi:hypothetical protein